MFPAPRPSHHTRRLAAVLAVSAAAAPALAAGPAHASPIRDSGVANNVARPAAASGLRDSGPANNAARPAATPVSADSGAADNGVATSSLAGTTAVDADRAPVADPAPVTVRTVDDGFDWGAAGLGAGTAAALGLLGLAGLQARTRAGTHLAG